jgi:hypothetical protein
VANIKQPKWTFDFSYRDVVSQTPDFSLKNYRRKRGGDAVSVI